MDWLRLKLLGRNYIFNGSLRTEPKPEPVWVRSSPLLSMQVNFLSEPIVPPACVSRRGSGPSAFPRGCGIIECPAATRRGERLSMRAEIRDADEAPELEGVGSSRIHRRRRRIGGPRMPVLPKPSELRVCGWLRRVRRALDRGAPPEVTRRTRRGFLHGRDAEIGSDPLRTDRAPRVTCVIEVPRTRAAALRTRPSSHHTSGRARPRR